MMKFNHESNLFQLIVFFFFHDYLCSFRCICDAARVSRVSHFQIFAPFPGIANFGLHVEELRQWVGLSGVLTGHGHYHLRHGHVLRGEECRWHQFHFHSRCFLVHHRHHDDARVSHIHTFLYFCNITFLPKNRVTMFSYHLNKTMMIIFLY